MSVFLQEQVTEFEVQDAAGVGNKAMITFVFCWVLLQFYLGQK